MYYLSMWLNSLYIKTNYILQLIVSWDWLVKLDLFEITLLQWLPVLSNVLFIISIGKRAGKTKKNCVSSLSVVPFLGTQLRTELSDFYPHD